MNHNLPLYYQKYPVYNLAKCNSKNSKDIEYLRMLYPREMCELSQLIKDECDKMDYDGSMMYDEYPDKLMYMKKCNEISCVAKVNCSYGKKCTDNQWLNDIINILLSNEMYNRRCSRRNYFMD